MSLPNPPLNERQAALGSVALKANWLSEDCGLLRNKELVQEEPAKCCLPSGQAGRQETGQSWEPGSENHVERLPQPKANSLILYGCLHVLVIKPQKPPQH